MASHAPILASPRVAPLASSSLTSASLNQTFRSAAATDPTISDLVRRLEDKQLQSTPTSLAVGASLQDADSGRSQLSRMCCRCSFRQRVLLRGEHFLFQTVHRAVSSGIPHGDAGLTMLSYAVILVVAHLPTLMSQRFLKYPDYKPSVWFCMRKLLKMSTPYFVASMGEWFASIC